MRAGIHKEIEKLKTTDVTDEELAMFKTRSRADLLRGLGENEGLAQQLAIYQLRYGDWRELFNQLQKIDAVSKADIRRVANKVFVDGNRTYAMVEFEAPKEAAQPSTAKAGAQ
jgi:predicted Zn-dependent peptidase